MLSQNIYRRDAETQRRSQVRSNVERRGLLPFGFLNPYLFALRLSVSAVIFLSLFSCSSKPTDMRSLVPAETLVYLESNDLGAALQPIVDNKAFDQAAKRKPDLSAI